MNFTSKKPIIHLCEDCNFKCGNKKDYNRHLLTAKHKIRTIRTEKNPKKPIVYDCKCGKLYKSRSSLWYHKKKCSLINEPIAVQENHELKPSVIDIISQNKEIMDALILQNEQLMKQNKEQSDTIKELIPK